MEKQIFQVPSTITKITTTMDKCLKLSVETQELSEQENAKVFSLFGKTGWFVFKDQPIKADELDLPEVKVAKGEKSDAQRLHGVLYVYWQQLGKPGTSEELYHQEMAKIINHYKSKLN